jgi:hypothetical protein
MSQTITGLFDTYAHAKVAVERLAAIGVPASDISLVASDAQGHLGDAAKQAAAAHKIGDDAGRGVGLGAIVGGTGGLLAGLGLLVIPGIGPVLAGGWLLATSVGVLGGAAVGGIAGVAAGGVVGALILAGVPDEDANTLAEGVRRGGAMVTARVAGGLLAAARSILAETRNVDIATRGEAYRAEGWSRFDPNAAPYSEAQAAAERERLSHV